MMRIEKIMKFVQKYFDEGQPLSKAYPVFEAMDTFLLTPAKVTQSAPFVRDALDLKRVMVFVVYGLLPCLFFGIYNVGYQMMLAQAEAPVFFEAVRLGLWKVIPLLAVVYAVGGFWEVLFAAVRRHEITEGFLVTGMLFTLVLPPTIPLWQAAIGISFGVVIGKEIFGGVGYNILNPALTGRAFLFFAYPASLSGEQAWVAVDGFTRATPLAVVASAQPGASAVNVLETAGYQFQDVFFGLIPGSIGETSLLACLLGMVFLLATGIASWKIMAGCAAGMASAGLVFWIARGADSPAFFSLPIHWHMALGGFAFGTIFMATDPVSSPATGAGRWIYGILIGMLIILIRIVNPAYPEGVMLAILFMNIFAPLIDHLVVESHVRKRLRRIGMMSGAAAAGQGKRNE